ncbi:MAG: DUF1178 family protein [Burkholderiales bacterium]|nr:DUF1178 family protein [Burkholderiales bacterium]
MIVFNLTCKEEHRFEGWFASAEAFASQCERGLVACPACGSTAVRKLLSAPRLNLGASAEAAPAPNDAEQGVAMLDARQRAVLELVQRVVASTEDVGRKFPEEARRIHYNEVPARAIRGVATAAEAKALAEEGIDVAHLPFPVAAKSELN